MSDHNETRIEERLRRIEDLLRRIKDLLEDILRELREDEDCD